MTVLINSSNHFNEIPRIYSYVVNRGMTVVKDLTGFGNLSGIKLKFYS